MWMPVLSASCDALCTIDSTVTVKLNFGQMLSFEASCVSFYTQCTENALTVVYTCFLQIYL